MSPLLRVDLPRSVIVIFKAEQIPNAPNGFDYICCTMKAQFFSQFFDLEFERCISANIVIFFPYMFKEFFFGHHFSNTVYEELQNIKLFWGQVEILSVQE